jgi:hypothetical protein
MLVRDALCYSLVRYLPWYLGVLARHLACDSLACSWLSDLVRGSEHGVNVLLAYSCHDRT